MEGEDVIKQLQAEEAAQSQVIPVQQPAEQKMSVQSVTPQAPKVMDIKPKVQEHLSMPATNNEPEPQQSVSVTAQQNKAQSVAPPANTDSAKTEKKKNKKPKQQSDKPIVAVVIAVLITGVLMFALYMVTTQPDSAFKTKSPVIVEQSPQDSQQVRPLQFTEIDAATKVITDVEAADLNAKDFDELNISDQALGL